MDLHINCAMITYKSGLIKSSLHPIMALTPLSRLAVLGSLLLPMSQRCSAQDLTLSPTVGKWT